MGAVFEVEVISRAYIPQEVSIAYLQQFGVSFVIERLECMRDWLWTGQCELKENKSNVKSALDEGQIVLIHGKLGEAYAGIFLEQNIDRTFHTRLWFEQSFYPMTGIADPIGSREFFTELETKMKKWLSRFSGYNLILAVMGEEIVFSYNPDLAYLREHSQVDKWIQF